MIDYTSLLFRVDPMTLQDIPAVMEIEEASFSAPWSARAYDYELRYNEMAYYFVARPQGRGVQSNILAPNVPARQSWWRRLFARSQTIASVPIVGHAGFWVMVDEAHISTLAARTEWRRRGIAELLLIAMTERAAEIGARVMTLEVRVSNVSAQALYHKYRFEIMGRRVQYYSDNNEDALIMTTPPIASAEYQRFFQAMKTELLSRLAIR
ncbi:MAG: ribosomal protein S18-alanine N-acetyltransferase [Anaerolineales bacterium]|nr:ribosomal protein S18-alanine N-acetyltransferase [Anaerolineales bacterium]